jgi:hypothetical protein
LDASYAKTPNSRVTMQPSPVNYDLDWWGRKTGY